MKENNGLPPRWELTTVGDIYKVLSGGTPSTKVEEYWGGDIPWITSANIHGLKDIRPERTVTKTGIENSSTNLVPKGSIIVVTRVSLGKVALAETDLCFSQDSQALLPTDKVHHGYALYYLSWAAREFQSKSRGTTISGITKKQLLTLDFPLPPCPEQERIVAKIEELFTQLEAGVAELQRAKAQLQRYRQAVLKSAVEGELTREWRAAHQSELEPAEELLARILSERRVKWEAEQWEKEIVRAQRKVAQAKRKTAGRPSRNSDLKPVEWENLTEDEYGRYLPKNDKWKAKYNEPDFVDDEGLSELPNDWTWATIGQVAESLDHMRVPVSKKVRAERQGNIPYYGANGQVGWIDDYIFDEPLVLVVEDETFTGRKIPFTYKITGKTWVNNHAHVLRPTSAVTVDFLNYSLMYYPFTPLTTGTTGRKKLTKTVLMQAPYSLPPLEEQKRIVQMVERRLSVADEIEKELDQALARSERLRQSILKSAFEGKLVV
jgi:type I restriction enzyme, S subunit